MLHKEVVHADNAQWIEIADLDSKKTQITYLGLDWGNEDHKSLFFHVRVRYTSQGIHNKNVGSGYNVFCVVHVGGF